MSAESDSKELLETKDLFNFQQQWINILRRGRFCLQEAPAGKIIEICRKMDPTKFTKAIRSCKWLNAGIEQNSRQFSLHLNKDLSFHYTQMKNQSSEWIIANIVRNRRFFRLQKVEFSGFDEDTASLQRIVNCFKDTPIFVREIRLIDSFAIRELFENFKTKTYRASILKSLPFLFQDEVPETLENVILVLGSGKHLLTEAVTKTIGKIDRITITLKEKITNKSAFEFIFEQVKYCFRILEEKSCRSNRITLNVSTQLKLEEVVLTLELKESFKFEGRHSGQLKYLLYYKNISNGMIAVSLEGESISIRRVNSVEAFDSFCRGGAKNFLKQQTFEEMKLYEEIEGYLIEIEKQNNKPLKEKAKTIQPKERINTEFLKLIPLRNIPKSVEYLAGNDGLENLKKLVEIQAKWLKLLRRRRYILEELPAFCILQIIKKMAVQEFVLMNRSAKFVKNIIDENRKKIFKRCKRMPLLVDCNKIENEGFDNWSREKLGPRTAFIFSEINLKNFQGKSDLLLKVTKQLAGNSIKIDRLELNLSTSEFKNKTDKLHQLIALVDKLEVKPKENDLIQLFISNTSDDEKIVFPVVRDYIQYINQLSYKKCVYLGFENTPSKPWKIEKKDLSIRNLSSADYFSYETAGIDPDQGEDVTYKFMIHVERDQSGVFAVIYCNYCDSRYYQDFSLLKGFLIKNIASVEELIQLLSITITTSRANFFGGIYEFFGEEDIKVIEGARKLFKQ